MTASRSALLHAVASSVFYLPKSEEDEKGCAELAELGYISKIAQGKLHGYCVVLKGTIYLRKKYGYE